MMYPFENRCVEVDELKEKLSQTNSELLRKYHKLAAKTDSIEEFIRMIE